nr:MAG TPA: hypothetical protein [Inoviridae sp.]
MQINFAIAFFQIQNNNKYFKGYNKLNEVNLWLR